MTPSGPSKRVDFVLGEGSDRARCYIGRSQAEEPAAKRRVTASWLVGVMRSSGRCLNPTGGSKALCGARSRTTALISAPILRDGRLLPARFVPAHVPRRL